MVHHYSLVRIWLAVATADWMGDLRRSLPDAINDCEPLGPKWVKTNILGGRSRYLATLFGVILIVLLNSVLTIMEMSEASRQIIYGTVIIAMLLVYGRTAKITNQKADGGAFISAGHQKGPCQQAGYLPGPRQKRRSHMSPTKVTRRPCAVQPPNL